MNLWSFLFKIAIMQPVLSDSQIFAVITSNIFSRSEVSIPQCQFTPIFCVVLAVFSIFLCGWWLIGSDILQNGFIIAFTDVNYLATIDLPFHFIVDWIFVRSIQALLLVTFCDRLGISNLLASFGLFIGRIFRLIVLWKVFELLRIRCWWELNWGCFCSFIVNGQIY
jgi:hypothetical protein